MKCGSGNINIPPIRSGVVDEYMPEDQVYGLKLDDFC